MTIRIEWDDLLIRDLQPNDCQRWLGPWSRWISDRAMPLYMSKFGDWFLRHPDGATSELSVIEGTYRQIASTPDDFDAQINSRDWQEEHLLSFFVLKLHERSMLPAAGQCYGFAPHPALSGKLDLDQVLVIEIGAWQAVCAQIFADLTPRSG